MKITKVKCSICDGEGGKSSPHGTAFFYICNRCNGQGFRYKHVCEGKFVRNSEWDHALYLICDDCGASGPVDNREFLGSNHIDYLKWCQHWADWEKRQYGYPIWFTAPDSELKYWE